MYATGVGLVIKGFQEWEKKSKTAAKITLEEEKKKKKIDKVVQPKETKNTFFELIAGMFKEEEDTRIDN
jgi:hypothetical protein